MSKRYDIVVGDKTTVGGVVLDGSPTSTINNKVQAVVGSKIACPKCGTTGVLQAAGSRVPDTDPEGREFALEQDICICGCHPPPLLIASQRLSSAEGKSGAALGEAASLASSALKNWDYDERFVIADVLGNPMPNTPYSAKLSSGEVIHDFTDNEGKTKRHITDASQKIEIHIGHIG